MKAIKYQKGGKNKKKKEENGEVMSFEFKETPKQKAERNLTDAKLGSRFDSSGKRKKGEAKKLAKEMRKFTGLDKDKMDRQDRRETRKFERKFGEGQEGLDKFKEKQRKKNKRKRKSSIRKKARQTRRTARKNQARTAAAGIGFGGNNCTDAGCGAYN